LMTCNLLVLATWLYSRIHPSGEETEDTSSSSPYSSDPLTFTTRTSRAARRRNAPNYDDTRPSALILTKLSSNYTTEPSSLSSSPPAPLPLLLLMSANAVFDRYRYRPRSRTLADGGLQHHRQSDGNIDPTTTMTGNHGTMPARHRPSHSCPASLLLTAIQSRIPSRVKFAAAAAEKEDGNTR